MLLSQGSALTFRSGCHFLTGRREDDRQSAYPINLPILSLMAFLQASAEAECTVVHLMLHHSSAVFLLTLSEVLKHCTQVQVSAQCILSN